VNEAIAPPHGRTLPFKLWRAGGTSPGLLVLAPYESTQLSPWGLMADGIVDWHFFDAESELVPEEFSPSILPGGGEGRIVVLAATPFAQAEGWASRAVVAIAKGWAQEKLRIFLMDLGLDAPSLHKAVGSLNREGVSDAFLYGASVQRIAQPALDDAIFFAPAGTATTDPEQILGHPRWDDLAGGFSEADATLLLFLPTDIPGADKILNRATDVLFLAGQGESAESHLGPASVKVVGMFGPMGSPSEETEEPMGDGGPSEAKSEMGVGEVQALDLDQGLSLAEGFTGEVGEGVEVEGEEPQGEPPPWEDVTEGPMPRDEFVLESADPGPEDFGREGVGSEGFGEGLVLEGAEFGDQGVPGEEVPDFGAEFAEMPSLEDEIEPVEPVEGEVQLGEEIVQESSETESDTGPADPPEGPKRSPHPADRPKPMSRRRPPPPKKKFPIPFVVGAVAVLAVLIAAVGTAVGTFNVPGFTWLQERFGEVPLPSLTLAGPEPNEALLRFSLELDIYEEDEIGVALEMRNALRDRLPNLIFNLTPQDSEGVVSYILYAGPAIDMVEVENLRGPLGEVLTREDPESWPVRGTPRAFYLGERATLAEAQEYLSSVEAAGALGYILHVTYPDGSEGYEVLSGSFQGAKDARWWQLALRESGFRDVPLIERRGVPPE